MTKYILTEAIVDALELLDAEATDLIVMIANVFNEAEISDSDFDDIDIAMTRLNDACEALKKTPKEEMTNESE